MAILWYNLKEINETNLSQSKWSSSQIILIVLRFFKSVVLKSLPPISVAWVWI